MGVGSHIRQILRTWFFVRYNRDCGCDKLRKKWDEWGCEKCYERREDIKKALKRQARKRGLPTTELVFELIVSTAIRRCRREQDE